MEDKNGGKTKKVIILTIISSKISNPACYLGERERKSFKIS